MATKIFSSRVDEAKLLYANAVAQREAGMSFGQFCGSVLLDYVNETGSLPEFDKSQERKDAIESLLAIAEKYASSSAAKRIAKMSDTEVKDLIASRYEA